MTKLLKLLHGHKKIMVTVWLLFLIGNSYYNLWSVRAIKEARLEEKFVEITNVVDTIAAAVNASEERYWELHEQNIIDSTSHIDNLYQVYAAAYKYNGKDLRLITPRIYETSPIDPFDYEQSDVVFSGAENGRFMIGYAPEFQSFREMHFYYRWMPAYSAPNEKYIIIAGVSEYSLQTSIPALHSIGQWVSTLIVAVLFLVFVFLDATLGYWWVSREKDCYREGFAEQG